MKKINKLNKWEVFKVFLKLKRDEIWEALKGFFLMAGVVIGFLSFMFLLVFILLKMPDKLCGVINIISGYLCVVLFGFLIFGILCLIQIWITDNWKKAKKIVRRGIK